MKKEILIGIAKDYGKVVLEVELTKMQEYKDRRNWEDLCRVNPEEAIEFTISGHYRGGCGQIYDSIPQMEWKELMIPQKTLDQLLDVWRNYHLNGMKSGTRIQSEFLQFAKSCPHLKWNDHYDMCCHLLRQHSLLIDRGYQYGHAWLYAPLPKEVIQFIQSYSPQSPPALTRSELLDWIISENIKFKISRTDSNPNMDCNNEMDHWLCEFWKENNPKKIFKCNYSTGIGHRIGNRRMTNQQITTELTKWRRKVYGSFGLPFPTFTTDKNKVSLKELGFNCIVPTMVFSHNDITSIPVPPMPDDVLNCIARETMDCENHGDWMDWATDLGYDLNSKSERRKLQKAFITMQDQADSFSSVFRNFPFALVE
jgi:hypothetical protein